MRVVDLFCGAGGFSEGFRQAGFNIVLGIDKWQLATDTFETNQTQARTVCRDIIEISKLKDDDFDSIIPDSEIIIGSPPCVDFSHSNRSGKADKSDGVELIKSFFRIIARKKYKNNSILRYWLFENVPNAEKYIQTQYSASELDLPEDYSLVVKNGSDLILDAQRYGVPSKRKRYVCGEFPTPYYDELADNYIPLRHLLVSLGKPCENLEDIIVDPNFPSFSLQSKEITDHHYIQKLAKYQCETAKRLKLDKGYMGRMSFPEDLERPSRTIMATMTLGARESMILPYSDNEYRAPTIREVASLMSFPIDYLFFGNSIRSKYRLVGNAVPPKLSYAFAKSIALAEGLSIPNKYIPISHKMPTSFVNFNFRQIPIAQEINILPTRRFKYHIPYLKIKQFRVELTNHHSIFHKNQIVWNAEIHRSQGPNAKIFTPKVSELLFHQNELLSMNNFINHWKAKIANAKEFQAIYCLRSFEREEKGLIGPIELLNQIKDYLNGLNDTLEIEREISIIESPYPLPLKIAMGYYILSNLLPQMKGE